MIILPTKPPAPDHIGDIVKSHHRAEWYYSILVNDEKMAKPTTFSAPFISSSLPP